ncbi:MAG TPA: 4a-hydroxytetrahydrobiopterin dehydratase [Dehalococcoidia bacterium]
MELSELLSRRCVERPKGSPTLAREEAGRLLPLVPGWELGADGGALRWRRRFADFAAAMAFVDRVAALAESEGHHPDIRVHSYRWVELALSTHSIGGLSENDFILAAKTNRLLEGDA